MKESIYVTLFSTKVSESSNTSNNSEICTGQRFCAQGLDRRSILKVCVLPCCIALQGHRSNRCVDGSRCKEHLFDCAPELSASFLLISEAREEVRSPGGPKFLCS